MRPLVTTCAILLAGVLAACTGQPRPDTTGTTSPSPTPITTATETAIATASPTSDGETASATASPAQGGPLGNAQECENEELEYEVEYPGDWWANERVEPEDDNLTPIPACQYFAPSEVELQPNAGLPNGIAIRFDIPNQEIAVPDDEILNEDDTTVDEHDARVVETEPAPQPGFVPEGARMYRYIITLEDGRQLIATTDNILTDDALYEESKAILDAMIETLEIDD